MGAQIDMFHVHQAYTEQGGVLSNDQLYDAVADLTGVSSDELNARQAIGKAGTPRSTLKRKIRWYQQTLKAMGVLERVEGERGMWRLADKQGKLHEAPGDVSMVAYSTELGVAIWSSSNNVYRSLDQPIHLCITSPPYPLAVQRAYGNVGESQWVDFITESLEPIVEQLAPGGSIVVNISNDIFQSKSPARSLYVERMVLALNDRLGLSLMDRWPWINLSKPPGPTYWACVNRYQLCSGWEPIFWFTNDPSRVRSDNRRVLQAHTEKHRKFLAEGNTRHAEYGGGAYRLRGAESYANQTPGRIPKNVITRGHRCSDTLAFRDAAKELGLPSHPAMFPTEIAEFAIKYLTVEGELVVDHFSGSNKVGLAAERLNRRWLVREKVLEYMRVQAEIFRHFSGFKINPALAA